VKAKPITQGSASGSSASSATAEPAKPRLKTGDQGDLSKLDLATGVDRIPELWNRHGNKVLLVFTALAIAYAAYSFRDRSVQNARNAAETNLTIARDTLADLRASPLANYKDEFYATKRKQALEDAGLALSEILEQSADDDYRCQALILRGDLYYTLALLPDRSAASTQPTLQLGQTSDQLMATAAQSYTKLISQYPTRLTQVAHARLGLAAIAENKGDFTGATDLYNKLVTDDATMASYKDIARRRLAMMPDLSKPMRLRGAASQPVSVPQVTTPSATPLVAPPAPMPSSVQPGMPSSTGMPELLPQFAPSATPSPALPASPATRP
jgi:hypothetical protein